MSETVDPGLIQVVKDIAAAFESLKDQPLPEFQDNTLYSLVSRASELLDFNQYVSQSLGVPLAKRWAAANSGFLQIAVEIIRNDRFQDSIDVCWEVVKNYVTIDDIDDKNERKPIEVFIDLGGIQLLCDGIKRTDRDRHHVLYSTMGWVAACDRAVPMIVSLGGHLAAIEHIRKGDEKLDVCMSFLRSATGSPSTRATLVSGWSSCHCIA